MPKRATKPTALRALEGGRSHSLPSPESAQAQEPKFPVGTPRKPHGLDKDAGYIWDQLKDPLVTAGLLTTADGILYAALCQMAARQEQIREAIKAGGGRLLTIQQKFFGKELQVEEEVPSPLITMERQNASELRKLAREFGLSPTARAGLVIGEADDGDDLLD